MEGSKLTLVKDDLKVSFSIATTQRCRGGCYSIPLTALLTLDPNFIILSVKQGGIKYHFLSLWYNSTWDWSLVSWTTGEHSCTILCFMEICRWKFQKIGIDMSKCPNIYTISYKYISYSASHMSSNELKILRLY